MAPSSWEILRHILTTRDLRSAILYSLLTGIVLLGVFILTVRRMTTKKGHDQVLNVEKAQTPPVYSKDAVIRQTDFISASPMQEISAYRRIPSSSEDPLSGVYYPITSGQLASLADQNTLHRERIQALTENVLEFERMSESKD